MSGAPSQRPFSPALVGVLGVLALGAAIRIHNAVRYPPDWGFDASFNWRYIYRMSQDWALPPPSAGWATGDPPLYFFLSGALMAAAERLSTLGLATLWIPLLSTAAGLGVVALAVLLVRRSDPDQPRRAWLAGALLLYLPAHIQMSAMVNEEMLASLLISFAIYGLALRSPTGADTAWRAAGVGLAAGLAVLTKLSGALAIAAGGVTYALDGLRRRALPAAATRIALLLLVASLAGGWYYARNRLEYGYFQPYALPAHQVMFEMPPGERSVLDYLRFPVATFRDPQLLNPDLLRSVWGSTYATVWFDGHRFFLPRESVSVSTLGSVSLLLALLPTAAFLVGLAGGTRRALASPGGPDLPLVALTALVLAGFVLFTWRNPWFAVVKGTSLLGLSLPFAYYASEVLARWTRRGGPLAGLLWLALGLLALCVVASSGFDLVFHKTEVSGLAWQAQP